MLPKDPGDPQQIRQGERARLGARQGGLPIRCAQDRVLAAPDQPDQDLRDDRAADRSQTLAILAYCRFREDVVPERRALQEPASLQLLDLIRAPRAVSDPVAVLLTSLSTIMDKSVAGREDLGLEDLRSAIRAFIRERDWEQFHSPKNLAMALSVEVAEIVEHFQWLTEEQSQNLPLE